MSWRTRSVEVEYQTLLEDESEWTAPENIDQFLQYTYDYFVGKGFATIAIGKSLEIVEMLFVAVMLTFLVCFIDYSQLSLVQHLSQAIAYQGTPFLVGVALLFFSSYFSWHVMLTVRDLYKFWSVADFYKRILKVDENRLPTMKWAADTTDRIDGVVDRLIKVPRLVRTRQQVTVLDIANRIMRRDNYLIALANSATPANQNLLRLPRWCWNVLGGKQLLATQVLERAVQIVIMPPLLAYAEAAERRLNSPPSPLPFGSMNDPSLQPQRRVTAMQRAAASIRTRARVLAVVGVVLAPVAALYMTLHSALEYAAALRSRPTALAARTWTPLTRWQCREYNELPHVFERRMNKAHQPAQKYLDAFPRTYLVVPARFGSFIVSALIACLLLLSLAEDDVLVKVEIAYGRAGVWWLGVLGSLLAVFRSVMPDVHVAHEPQKHLNEVTAHTHDAPLAWQGRAHDVAVRDEFSQRYQLRLLLALRELLSLLLAPVLLAWHVPYLADDLVTFVDRHTANVEGVGTVCQLALFNTKGVGDGGKLAKSMISFQAHHPKWCPPPASKATLAGVAAFARATPRKSRAQEQRGEVRRPRRRSPSPDTAPPSSRTNDNDDNVVVGAQGDADRTSRTASAIESSFAQLRASLEHSDDFRAGPAVLRGSSRGFARGGGGGGGGDDDDDDDNDAAVSALDNVVDQMVAARIADAITAGTAQDINQLLQESDDFMAGPASSQSFVKLDNNNDHDDFDYHRAQ